MKKIIYLLFLLLPCMSRAQQLPEIPNPPKLVNDFAGVMTKEQEDQLEHKLHKFNDSTSNQIAVIIIKSLNGYPIDDYTIKTFQKWKIGTKRNNNGVLVLLSIDEHKIWITVGRGLESVLTDARCREAIDLTFTPPFKKSAFFQGLDEGTNELMTIANGEYHEVPPTVSHSGDFYLPVIAFVTLFVGFWGFFIFLFIRSHNKQILYTKSGKPKSLPKPFFFAGLAYWFQTLPSGSSSGSSSFSSSDDSSSSSSSSSDSDDFGGGDTGGGGAGGSW